MCIDLVKKYSTEYQRQIEYIAPLINEIASYVPKRRMRKLHVGLFGYSRSLGRVRLPRVIGFCAACYSIGLPPEILGLNSLEPWDMEYLRQVYVNFERDIERALRYLNPECLDLLPVEIRGLIKTELFDYEPDMEHRLVTSRIINAIKEGKLTGLQNMIIEAAHIRRFLG